MNHYEKTKQLKEEDFKQLIGVKTPLSKFFEK